MKNKLFFAVFVLAAVVVLSGCQAAVRSAEKLDKALADGIVDNM